MKDKKKMWSKPDCNVIKYNQLKRIIAVNGRSDVCGKRFIR